MKYIPLQLGLIYLVNYNFPSFNKKIYTQNINYYNKFHPSLYSKKYLSNVYK